MAFGNTMLAIPGKFWNRWTKKEKEKQQEKDLTDMSSEVKLSTHSQMNALKN